jgi:VanZ family protein
LVTIPIQRQGVIINNYHVVHIRLDHILHGLLMMPWFFLSIRLHGMKVLPAILLGILLALSAEGVQYFLPYRAFNVNDMISNVIGMMLGAGIIVFSIDKDARHTAHDARRKVGDLLWSWDHDTGNPE